MIGTHAAGLFAPSPAYGTPPIWGGPQEAQQPMPAMRPAAPAAPPAPANVWDRINTGVPDLSNHDNWSRAAGTFDDGARGVGQRVTDWMGQNSGALLRAAGAAFNGDGLGGAIQAGAGYADHQRAIEAQQQQQQLENGFEQLKLIVAQNKAAADAGKVHYQVVPPGGGMVGLKSDGSFVDPAAASKYLAGNQQPSAPQPAGAAPVRVTTDAEYAALPPGATFITDKGETRRKGGAPSPGGGTFR